MVFKNEIVVNCNSFHKIVFSRVGVIIITGNTDADIKKISDTKNADWQYWEC